MGVAKPAEAAIMTMITNGHRLTPSDSAVAAAIGKLMTAAALLVTISVITFVKTYTAASARNGFVPAAASHVSANPSAAPLVCSACPTPNDAPMTVSTDQSTLARAVLPFKQRVASMRPAATSAGPGIERNTG